MRKKEGQGGRRDGEEGRMGRKEGRGGRRDVSEKMKKLFKRMKKSLKDASLASLGLVCPRWNIFRILPDCNSTRVGVVVVYFFTMG